MGKLLGRTSPRRGRATVGFMLAASPLLMALTACGDGDDDPSVAGLPADSGGQEVETGLLPCSEDRHLAVFDIIGFLTQENLEGLTPWQQGTPPTPRAGSAELVQAHRQKGFEVLYITTIPPDFFGERSVQVVVDEWLGGHGFPLGTGAHFWGWDGVQRPDGQTWVSITDELLRFASEGYSVDFSYTENTDKAYAFATGGVPAEANFTLTPVEGLHESPTSAPTTLIPNDNLVDRAATVQQMAPICQIS
jgi:hypothetical protein